MSLSTKRSYVNSITNYIYYYKDKRGKFVHPTELGSSNIRDYLIYDMWRLRPKMACCAPSFLYKQMLNLAAFVLLKFKDAAQKIRVQQVGELITSSVIPKFRAF